MVVRVRSVAAPHEAPDVAGAPFVMLHHAGEGAAVLRDVLRRAGSGRDDLVQVLRHSLKAAGLLMVLVVPRARVVALRLQGQTTRVDHGGRGRAVARHRCSIALATDRQLYAVLSLGGSARKPGVQWERRGEPKEQRCSSVACPLRDYYDVIGPAYGAWIVIGNVRVAYAIT